jgi:hypothetical protein
VLLNYRSNNVAVDFYTDLTDYGYANAINQINTDDVDL